MTDRELLAQYAASASAGAFAEIARRHAGAVYGTCLRLLNDAHAAEDAAQGVFLALAKKAKGLSGGTVLAGWLHDAARKAALEWSRREARRRRHEQEAAKMRAMETEASAAQWEEVRPKLDQALASLSAAQRNVILLRHVAGKPEAEVAEELGWSRSRVSVTLSRALAALREKLVRRGAGVPAVALGAMLVENVSGLSAPAGLVASIQSVCLGKAAASTAAAQIGEGVMRAFFWAKMKLAAAVIGAVAVVGTGGGFAAKHLLAGEGASTPPAIRADAKWKVELWGPLVHADGDFSTGPVGQTLVSNVGGVLAMAQLSDGSFAALVGQKSCELRIVLIKDGRMAPLAGNGISGFRDGPAGQAMFSAVQGGYNNCWDLGADGKGNAYFSDVGNNRIRRLRKKEDGRWHMETIAGGGARKLKVGESAPGREISLEGGAPHLGIAGDDLIWIMNVGGSLYKYVPTNGMVTRVPGAGEQQKNCSYFTDMDGDGEGNAFITSESGGNPTEIWRIDREGKINHLAGHTRRGQADNVYAGPIEKTYFWTVTTIISPPGRYVYVNGGDENVPRRIDKDGSEPVAAFCHVDGSDRDVLNKYLAQRLKGWPPVATFCADGLWKQVAKEGEGRGMCGFYGWDRQGNIYWSALGSAFGRDTYLKPVPSACRARAIEESK